MCNCIEQVNKALAERNTVLCEGTLINFKTGARRQTLMIETEKITKSRQSTVSVYPSFCPFCGVKISTTDDPHNPAEGDAP